MTARPVLRVRELTVRRGSTTVVEGLDWSVAPGRPAWVVGPNGAGKSTLLRTLAGLHRPDAGRIEREPTAERPLYFHAETALPGEATVRDWDSLAGRLLKRGTGAGHTPLWPAVPGGRRISRLSTGERKRLILDLLLRQPGRVLLMDEPYEHLSAGAKEALTAIVVERAASGIVVVATNQVVGPGHRDRGLRLDGGAATPLEPADR